ncbi:Scr1 family TA system antitoxin-like transcriptional regulator [Lentzea sp. NPDC006480]|uniref:Scr1 family TA system antitoxin-like transcriptional regulator n=1 Tax=Lentzea sp. NPDC006480 TaxID=3157176 RepID=UPI00339ED9EC
MALQLVNGRASLEVRALSRTVLGWRTKRDWSLLELGARVGFSTAKLSHLCQAAQRMSPSEVVTVGAACGASDDEVELCMRVAQRAIDPQMWDRINGDAWARLTWTPWDVLAEASELVIVAAGSLPELVRAGGYHAALVESGAAANDLDLANQQEALSRLRLGTKQAEKLRRLNVRLIVTEQVLNGGVGDSRVMADQLEHLAELDELPGFELQIVDGDVGPYFGMGVSFTLMRFVEKRFDDVVLLNTLHGGNTWLESAAERTPYERVLVALRNVVRTEELSLLWLNEASLRLRDPARRLQLVTDQARS